MSVFHGATHRTGGFVNAHLGTVPAAKPEPTAAKQQDAPVLDAGAFGMDESDCPVADDLSQMTNEQLRELLEDNGVDVPKRATKSQLVALAQEAGL